MTSKTLLSVFDKGVFVIIETKYDKPFKTYDELIEIMISRNIVITDLDFTKNALSNFSYYTLVNGYKDTFLSLDGSDNFVPGTKFDELYTIHLLDTNLSSILLKYILHIEHSLKSKLSYIISKEYGVYSDFSIENNKSKDDYLYLKNYSSSNNRRKNILWEINQCGVEPRKNLSLIHYKESKNHVPPWILIGNVPFGLTIQWYSILKDAEKSYVCDQLIDTDNVTISERKEFLLKSLYILKDYRNSMAHGIRTFANITSNELPKKSLLTLSPALINEHEYLLRNGKTDLYSVLIIICILLNDSHLAENLMLDFAFLFNPYTEKKITFCGKTIFEVFGMPEDLLTRVHHFNINRYTNK